MDDIISGTTCSTCHKGKVHFNGITIENKVIYKMYKCDNQECLIDHLVKSKILIKSKPDLEKPKFWYEDL